MAREVIIGVYAITDISSGRIYIGSSVDVFVRWSVHRRYLRSDRHINRRLQNAWNKRGESSFTFTILERVESREALRGAEQRWIDATPNKFNVRDEAYEIYFPPSDEESRRKLLERAACPIRRAKISASAKGRIVSAETRRMIGDAHRGKVNSPEERARISKMNKGRKHKPRSKEFREFLRDKQVKTYKMVDPDGNVVQITNMKEFCKDTDLCAAHMRAVCRGERNVHKGWKAFFEPDESQAMIEENRDD